MKSLSKINEIFFLSVLIGVLYFCYLIFEPFLTIIFVAGAFSVTLYSPYKKLLKKLRGRKNIAAGLMCLLILMVVIIPVSIFIFFLSQNTVEAYSALSINMNADFLQNISDWFNNTFSNIDLKTAIKENLGNIAVSINGALLDVFKLILSSLTQFVVSSGIMLMTVFFLFRDGKTLLERLIRLTPLPDKYDREIFNKFREVSYSAIMSTIVTGAAQGIVSGVAFYIVGVPVLLLAFATFFASFIPFVGVGLIMVPTVFYLIFIGSYWQAVFLLLWAGLVVGAIDNFLRPLLMQGKTQVHPLLLFFSIFGGMFLFGFWGVIFGPLIIAITLTLLHIYEVEYCELLGACEIETPKKTRKRKSKVT